MNKKQRDKRRNRAKVEKINICINCGKAGSHFMPPCLGEKGYFVCL